MSGKHTLDESSTDKKSLSKIGESVSDEKGSVDDGQDACVRNEEKPDPTRYGDWEKNGRCIDF